MPCRLRVAPGARSGRGSEVMGSRRSCRACCDSPSSWACSEAGRVGSLLPPHVLVLPVCRGFEETLRASTGEPGRGMRVRAVGLLVRSQALEATEGTGVDRSGRRSCGCCPGLYGSQALEPTSQNRGVTYGAASSRGRLCSDQPRCRRAGVIFPAPGATKPPDCSAFDTSASAEQSARAQHGSSLGPRKPPATICYLSKLFEGCPRQTRALPSGSVVKNWPAMWKVWV